MSEEKKPREELGLDDDALDTVTGGTTDPATPAPVPTGGVTYKCKCGYTISASTRDLTVTCPKCRCTYKVKSGKLVLS